MSDYSFSWRHVLFGAAGFAATVYTLAIPRGLADNTALAVAQAIGAFMLVFGVSVLVRIGYIRRTRREVPLWSPWLTVIALVVAFAAATIGR
jgi:hypothetical protein